MPKYRIQFGDDREEVSAATGTINNGEELTRQEYADEADLNILLARFGVQTPVRQMVYGTEVDYNLDLQQAFAAIDAARRINRTVPDELRDQFPDWRAVLNGAESGEYAKALQDLVVRKAEADKAAEAAKTVTP